MISGVSAFGIALSNSGQESRTRIQDSGARSQEPTLDAALKMTPFPIEEGLGLLGGHGNGPTSPYPLLAEEGS